MSGSVNKVILVGNVGNQPEVRHSQHGNTEIATFSIATSEKWKDKASGEQKEKTDWHKVTVFAPGLVTIIKNYVKKGSKLYIEGKLQTREYIDQNGNKRYTTEVILSQYNGTLTILDIKSVNNSSNNKIHQGTGDITSKSSHHDIGDTDSLESIEDDIPF